MHPLVEEPSILTVDDDRVDRRVVKRLLSNSYRVLEATSGTEALALLSHTPKPACVLLDYRLPDMDGLMFLDTLAQNEGDIHLPIIMVTGQGDELIAVEAMKRGAVDYLVKDQLETGLLEHAIQRAIHQKETEAQLAAYTRDLAGLTMKLATSEKRLRELNANKDAFFGIVSHDLRDPIVGLHGLIKLLRDRFATLSPADTQKWLDDMYAAVDQVRDLLNHLLGWAKTQMGTVEFNPEHVNLRTLVAQSVAALETRLAQKNLQLDFSQAQGWVKADANMIAFVLRNLVGNAIKFTPAGGCITISASASDDLFEISVQDTGIGMTPDQCDKLFRLEDRYTRLGTDGERGTGFGLLRCHAFVEKHGGTIGVESEESQGSRFWFTLPATDPLMASTPLPV